MNDLDEAIKIVNSRDKPLALYVFSDNEQTVDRVIGATFAGGSCVNDCLFHNVNPNLPFGAIVRRLCVC